MDRFYAGIPFADFNTEWSPTIDISETDSEIKIRAELPGLDKNDLNVDVYRNMLSIKGEKKEEGEKKDEGSICKKFIMDRLSATSGCPVAYGSKKRQS
jgi:HSP20 family protein